MRHGQLVAARGAAEPAWHRLRFRYQVFQGLMLLFPCSKQPGIAIHLHRLKATAYCHAVADSDAGKTASGVGSSPEEHRGSQRAAAAYDTGRRR